MKLENNLSNRTRIESTSEHLLDEFAVIGEVRRVIGDLLVEHVAEQASCSDIARACAEILPSEQHSGQLPQTEEQTSKHWIERDRAERDSLWHKIGKHLANAASPRGVRFNAVERNSNDCSDYRSNGSVRDIQFLVEELFGLCFQCEFALHRFEEIAKRLIVSVRRNTSQAHTHTHMSVMLCAFTNVPRAAPASTYLTDSTPTASCAGEVCSLS